MVKGVKKELRYAGSLCIWYVWNKTECYQRRFIQLIVISSRSIFSPSLHFAGRSSQLRIPRSPFVSSRSITNRWNFLLFITASQARYVLRTVRTVATSPSQSTKVRVVNRCSTCWTKRSTAILSVNNLRMTCPPL